MSLVLIIILTFCLGVFLALGGLVWLVCRGGRAAGAGARPAGAPPAPTLEQRTEELRRRTDRYQEERRRILAMVADKRLSPEDSERLFAVLERETMTMACPFCGGDVRTDAVTCKHCHAWLVEEYRKQQVTPKRLTRSRQKVLAGVCGGLADYLGVDPVVVRVLTVVVTLLTAVFTAVLIYIIAACIMPAANA